MVLRCKDNHFFSLRQQSVWELSSGVIRTDLGINLCICLILIINRCLAMEIVLTVSRKITEWVNNCLTSRIDYALVHHSSWEVTCKNKKQKGISLSIIINLVIWIGRCTWRRAHYYRLRMSLFNCCRSVIAERMSWLGMAWHGLAGLYIISGRHGQLGIHDFKRHQFQYDGFNLISNITFPNHKKYDDVPISASLPRIQIHWNGLSVTCWARMLRFRFTTFRKWTQHWYWRQPHVQCADLSFCYINRRWHFDWSLSSISSHDFSLQRSNYIVSIRMRLVGVGLKGMSCHKLII